MGLFGMLLDLYENIRPTTSNKPISIKKRNYDFDAGITGDKKTDCNNVNQSSTKRVKEENSKDGEER